MRDALDTQLNIKNCTVFQVTNFLSTKLTKNHNQKIKLFVQPRFIG